MSANKSIFKLQNVKKIQNVLTKHFVRTPILSVGSNDIHEKKTLSCKTLSGFNLIKMQ